MELKSTFDYTAIKKAQGKVKTKYNRVAKALGKMGLTTAEDSSIEAILKPKFEKELQEAAANANGTAAPMV